MENEELQTIMNEDTADIIIGEGEVENVFFDEN